MAAAPNGLLIPSAMSSSPVMSCGSCVIMFPAPPQSEQLYQVEPQAAASPMNLHYPMQQVEPAVLMQRTPKHDTSPLCQHQKQDTTYVAAVQRAAWKLQIGQAAVEASNGCSSEGHQGKDTTLMIRNLPESLTQQALLHELDQSGFRERYDFAYMPSCRNTGGNKGYAFINLVDASIASAFKASWHRSRRFGLKEGEAFLNVSAARIQGLQANLERWCGARTSNTTQPFVRKKEVRPPGSGPLQTASDISSFNMGSLAQVQASSAVQRAQVADAMPQFQVTNSQNSFVLSPYASGQAVPIVQTRHNCEDSFSMTPLIQSHNTSYNMMHGRVAMEQVGVAARMQMPGATHAGSTQPVLRHRHQINLAAAIDSSAMPSLSDASRVALASCGEGATVPTQSTQSPLSCSAEDFGPSKEAADVTTLMIRNFPNDVTQQRLMDELAEGGFGEAYDFVYMPTDASTKQNKGYAFLNMISTSLAGIFIGAWHLSRRFGTVLSVSVAELQGFQANVNRWGSSRKRHMQDPCFQPFIRPPSSEGQQSL